MNQVLNVDKPAFDSLSRRRLDRRAQAAWRWSGEEWRRLNRNRIDRGQRENRMFVIIDCPRMRANLTADNAVRLKMTMDDQVYVALFSGFVHVLGRNDRE